MDVAVELPLGVGEGCVGVLQVDHLLPRVGELLLHLPLAPGRNGRAYFGDKQFLLLGIKLMETFTIIKE